MKKYYSEPELIVRNYKLIPGNVVMTSDPNAGDTNLNDGDEQNPWGNGGRSNAPLFNE